VDSAAGQKGKTSSSAPAIRQKERVAAATLPGKFSVKLKKLVVN
jgi:hypothetical protein